MSAAGTSPLYDSASHQDAAWAILRAVAGDFGRVEREQRAGRPPAWLLVFWVSGSRYRIRQVPIGDAWVRIPDEYTAGVVLDAIRADVRRGTPRLAALAPYLRGKAPDLLFGACWDRFCEAKWRQGRAGGRQITRQRVSELEGHRKRGHLAPLLEIPAHRIGPAQLEDWKDWLFAERGLAPGSVRHLIRDVGTCLHWLARREEIPKVPELPHVQVPDHTPRIPSPAEVRQLLDAIPWAVRGQWLARSQLGLRPSEAQRANVADWRFEPESFRLPDGSELAAHVLTVRGKGGRVRLLPVPAAWELAVWIGEHREAKDALQGDAAPLFPNPAADRERNESGRWTKASSRRVWVAASRAANLMDGSRPRYVENESMRHAFATHAAEAGVELLRLSEFMGHSDPRTTRRYRKLGAGAFLEVVKR